MDVVLDASRPEFQRAILKMDQDDHSFVAFVTGSQQSSRLLSMNSMNVLLKLPIGDGLSKGSFVDAFWIQ